MRAVVLLMTTTMLVACAKAPDQIAAIPFQDTIYQGQGCKSLAAHELQETQKLASLSAAQTDAQEGDALGVLLIGLPLSSMAGADKEAEIAVTKGRLDAIDRAQLASNCS